MGEKLQFSKLKIKNLQKWAQFLMLEIKRFAIHIYRYYAFLCKKSLSHAESTFRCRSVRICCLMSLVELWRLQ